MLNLRHVETLLAIHTAGGFHEAARRLGRPQPTLTQHIQKLELELGVPLLVRRGAGCQLTAEGEAFLPYARSLLRTAARAREAIHGRRLALGASGNIGTYLLPPILARLAASGTPVPEVTIGPNPLLADKLERGELDVAVTEWWDGRRGFTATPWREEQLVVIVAPSHSWSRRRWIDKDNLLSERMIGGEPGTGTGRILAKTLGDLAGDLRVELSLGSTEAVKNAVRCGLGISVVMASTVAAETEAGTLVALPIRGARLAKQLFTVVPEGLSPQSPTSRLVDQLRLPVALP